MSFFAYFFGQILCFLRNFVANKIFLFLFYFFVIPFSLVGEPDENLTESAQSHIFEEAKKNCPSELRDYIDGKSTTGSDAWRGWLGEMTKRGEEGITIKKDYRKVEDFLNEIAQGYKGFYKDKPHHSLLSAIVTDLKDKGVPDEAFGLIADSFRGLLTSITPLFTKSYIFISDSDDSLLKDGDGENPEKEGISASIKVILNSEKQKSRSERLERKNKRELLWKHAQNVSKIEELFSRLPHFIENYNKFRGAVDGINEALKSLVNKEYKEKLFCSFSSKIKQGEGKGEIEKQFEKIVELQYAEIKKISDAFGNSLVKLVGTVGCVYKKSTKWSFSDTKWHEGVLVEAKKNLYYFLTVLKNSFDALQKIGDHPLYIFFDQKSWLEEIKNKRGNEGALEVVKKAIYKFDQAISLFTVNFWLQLRYLYSTKNDAILRALSLFITDCDGGIKRREEVLSPDSLHAIGERLPRYVKKFIPKDLSINDESEESKKAGSRNPYQDTNVGNHVLALLSAGGFAPFTSNLSSSVQNGQQVVNRLGLIAAMQGPIAQTIYDEQQINSLQQNLINIFNLEFFRVYNKNKNISKKYSEQAYLDSINNRYILQQQVGGVGNGALVTNSNPYATVVNAVSPSTLLTLLQDYFIFKKIVHNSHASNDLKQFYESLMPHMEDIYNKVTGGGEIRYVIDEKNGNSGFLEIKTNIIPSDLFHDEEVLNRDRKKICYAIYGEKSPENICQCTVPGNKSFMDRLVTTTIKVNNLNKLPEVYSVLKLCELAGLCGKNNPFSSLWKDHGDGYRGQQGMMYYKQKQDTQIWGKNTNTINAAMPLLQTVVPALPSLVTPAVKKLLGNGN